MPKTIHLVRTYCTSVWIPGLSAIVALDVYDMLQRETSDR